MKGQSFTAIGFTVNDVLWVIGAVFTVSVSLYAFYRVRTRISMRTSEASSEQHDGGGIEEGRCRSDGSLEVLARRRLRPSQAKKRSTTQRLGCTAKPIWPACLRTISTMILVAFATRSAA